MPAASYDTVIKDLRSGKFAPLYFLEGEEPYFIDKIADHIEAHALDEAQRDFNQTVLYGKDTSIADVISSAQRYPVFSDRQVVVIREAQHLFSGQGFKEADEKILQSYLENIVPTTILVFCHKYKTLDKRKSISKLIREKAVFVESPKVKENALPEWINRLAHDNGFGIEPRTSQLLAEHLGADLSRIAGEMEKLQLLLPAGSTITDEVVEDHIGISKEFNAFELSDALMKKDFHKCMRILQYFSHNPNAGPMPLIMGSLYNQLSKLYVVLSSPGLLTARSPPGRVFLPSWWGVPLSREKI